MPAINLEEFSTPELRELVEEIDKEIKRRQVEDVKKVLAEMKGLAAGIGMTVEEVVGAEKAKKTKTTGVPKFRNPDNPEQTWTGRGKQPGWVKEALEQGKELEDLRIR